MLGDDKTKVFKELITSVLSIGPTIASVMTTRPKLLRRILAHLRNANNCAIIMHLKTFQLTFLTLLCRNV